MPEQHPDALSIRPSGLSSAAGGPAENDYVIKWQGIEIGRIYKATGGMVPAERLAIRKLDLWLWFLAIFPAEAWHQGRAATLDEAKAAFKAALDKVPAECRVPLGYHAGREDWKREHGEPEGNEGDSGDRV